VSAGEGTQNYLCVAQAAAVLTGLAVTAVFSGHDGVATGTVAVLDHHGQIGSGVANALANPGFRPPY
jgi:hypothetical protein